MEKQNWENLKSWLLQYKAIDENVESPNMIKRLDLSGNSLTSLPEEIGLLSDLIVLNLSHNNLENLPESIKNLTMLSNLDLRRNLFTALPSVLGELSLKSLNASRNKIKDASVLHTCTQLRVLDLSANELISLDNCFLEENELRSVNISTNFIKDLKNVYHAFSTLERLNVSENLLDEIPSSVIQMQELIDLNLSENNIEKIDDALFTLALEHLNLCSNRITKIDLHGFEDLEILLLDENFIKEITVSEDFAPYLKEFSCDGCSLENFVLLPSIYIEYLCFSSNNISVVPQEIGKYINLTKLDLESNNISKLPNSIANMTKVQTLYLADNPLDEDAKDIVEILHPEICDINMKTGIVVEAAKEEDLVQMAHLVALLFAIEKDFTIDFDKQLSGITKLFNYEGADLIVAKHEGKVVGMVTMQRLISSAAGDYIGQIEDLVVDEEYRKMGVGSRLLNKVRFIGLEVYGYKRVQLAADMDNENAKKFYSIRGFRKTNLNMYHLAK